MKTIVKTLTLITLILFVSGSVYAGKRDPVGVLFQAKGKVEYTKKGKKWRKVRRSKFLFSGYQVRTGPDSSAKVTLKESDVTMDIGPNAMIKVSGGKLVAQNGNLEAADSSGKLLSGLMKKFNKAQSYTTVRRSHKKHKLRMKAVRSVNLTDEYPYMVWNNVGEKYNYRLTVGDQSYEVPATDDEVVRVKVEPFSGEKKFSIQVLEDGKPVTEAKKYKSRGKYYPYTMKWLGGEQKSELQSEISQIQDAFGEDSFMLGSFFEKQDMWVAAMDQYRLYLNENPDELEMTPYLFRVYKKLKLNDIYKKELEQWKAATLE